MFRNISKGMALKKRFENISKENVEEENIFRKNVKTEKRFNLKCLHLKTPKEKRRKHVKEQGKARRKRGNDKKHTCFSRPHKKKE
jgi:hypothetical protein